MATDTTKPDDSPTDLFSDMLKMQGDLANALFAPFTQGWDAATSAVAPPTLPFAPAEVAQWGEAAQKLQALWLQFSGEQAAKLPAAAPAALGEPARWLELVEGWYKHMPMASDETRERLWQDSLKLWNGLMGQYGLGEAAGKDTPDLPRADKRFADSRWREQPVFALLHQSYLLFAEQLMALAEGVEGIDPARKEQLRFATRTMVEALSPANFPMTNPVVLERTMETRGENLVRGMEHLLADLTKGQLTHTDPDAFKVGRDIAITPGKVVHQSALFQLIQYSPTTENVLATPVVIFPPWINRFYILDLNPAKSFVRWAVEQGLTVFMVSWKSADASMAEVTWDDYVRAQIEAIEVACARLKVPQVHAIGYCVAGTTLAATLAVLGRRGQSAKVKSATFFTAQVDFELAGELKNFVDDHQLAAISSLAQDGYLDGRYMAATFNLLRGSDLIWQYVINNYLLGEDYPAFELLHWNGDTTNLPCKWHQAYLRDLYRDNRLVIPDALEADGTPIDLGRIDVPCFIQAGREDHIAPPESVWRLTRHLRSPWTFVLAGSGHIAGVVNPPAARKYQFWTNDSQPDSYGEFVGGAQEHPGSWWNHWLGWLRAQAPEEVAATGKRKPGGRGDTVIEDAPGSYVLEH